MTKASKKHRLNWIATAADHQKLKILALQWGLSQSEAVTKLIENETKKGN